MSDVLQGQCRSQSGWITATELGRMELSLMKKEKISGRLQKTRGISVGLVEDDYYIFK